MSTHVYSRYILQYCGIVSIFSTVLYLCLQTHVQFKVRTILQIYIPSYLFHCSTWFTVLSACKGWHESRRPPHHLALYYPAEYEKAPLFGSEVIGHTYCKITAVICPWQSMSSCTRQNSYHKICTIDLKNDGGVLHCFYTAIEESCPDTRTNACRISSAVRGTLASNSTRFPRQSASLLAFCLRPLSEMEYLFYLYCY